MVECVERPVRERWELRAAVASFGAAVLVVVSACGEDDGIGRRYPVSGTVTYKGEPLEQGTINFQTTSAEGRSAGGMIEKGSYTLTTHTPNDGALPGTYRVSIIAKKIDASGLGAGSGEVAAGTMPSRKDVGAAFQQAERLIPAKYESPDTSGLEAVVEEQSNTIDFDLTD